MKVELIGLSQGISFESKQATNFLDFRKDTGELFRLPVPQTVAEELLTIILQDDKPKTASVPVSPPEPPPESEDATEFGDEDTGGGVEEPVVEEDEFPASEDEVPSV